MDAEPLPDDDDLDEEDILLIRPSRRPRPHRSRVSGRDVHKDVKFLAISLAAFGTIDGLISLYILASTIQDMLTGGFVKHFAVVVPVVGLVFSAVILRGSWQAFRLRDYHSVRIATFLAALSALPCCAYPIPPFNFLVVGFAIAQFAIWHRSEVRDVFE